MAAFGPEIGPRRLNNQYRSSCAQTHHPSGYARGKGTRRRSVIFLADNPQVGTPMSRHRTFEDRQGPRGATILYLEELPLKAEPLFIGFRSPIALALLDERVHFGPGMMSGEIGAAPSVVDPVDHSNDPSADLPRW